MNILKCKICGGDLEVAAGARIGTCQYCGTTITLPTLDSDQKTRLFNRANNYRLGCDFDKAYDAYKAITEEDTSEAEAYWGMLLSEYGIEYVDDEKSGKKIPTCHRTHMVGPLNNVNYKLACQYANTENRLMYEEECETISKIQKKILSISTKAEPYDVFICYKETDDATGERTNDSVLAQEIYQSLEKEGLKVFFSRISLEDKLGVEYEPYIFSALNSAKVMLLVTTSNDNCDSVWVKNEWMRFLHMMENDDSKTLIPVLKDMTPYELPDVIAGFQAQDMSKVGAVQDLCRGVKKLVSGSGNDISKAVDDIVERKLKKSNRRYKVAIAVIVVFFIGAIVAVGWNRTPQYKYAKGVEAFDNGEYDYAKNMFLDIPDYKDSNDYIDVINVGHDVKFYSVEQCKKLIELDTEVSKETLQKAYDKNLEYALEAKKDFYDQPYSVANPLEGISFDYYEEHKSEIDPLIKTVVTYHKEYTYYFDECEWGGIYDWNNCIVHSAFDKKYH